MNGRSWWGDLLGCRGSGGGSAGRGAREWCAGFAGDSGNGGCGGSCTLCRHSDGPAGCAGARLPGGTRIRSRTGIKCGASPHWPGVTSSARGRSPPSPAKRCPVSDLRVDVGGLDCRRRPLPVRRGRGCAVGRYLAWRRGRRLWAAIKGSPRTASWNVTLGERSGDSANLRECVRACAQTTWWESASGNPETVLRRGQALCGWRSSAMYGTSACRKSGASKISPAEATPTVLVRPVRTRSRASATRGAVTA